MNTDDKKDFKGFLRLCTDQQVLNVYQKEREANREDYAELAYIELCKRGLASAHD